MKKLSILICTLERRKRYFDRLMQWLTPQLTDEVEVIHLSDVGDISIGAKRNALVKMATGLYSAFIDDDDIVSTDYVAKVMQATNKHPDCIGMEGIITTDGNNPKKFIHSLRYRHWFERRGVYYRNPNHLNPIKREIVMLEPFPEINMGEDAEFSKSVLKHLKSEIYIEGPIYYYEFRTQKEI